MIIFPYSRFPTLVFQFRAQNTFQHTYIHTRCRDSCNLVTQIRQPTQKIMVLTILRENEDLSRIHHLLFCIHCFRLFCTSSDSAHTNSYTQTCIHFLLHYKRFITPYFVQQESMFEMMFTEIKKSSHFSTGISGKIKHVQLRFQIYCK